MPPSGNSQCEGEPGCSLTRTAVRIVVGKRVLRQPMANLLDAAKLIAGAVGAPSRSIMLLRAMRHDEAHLYDFRIGIAHSRARLKRAGSI